MFLVANNNNNNAAGSPPVNHTNSVAPQQYSPSYARSNSQYDLPPSYNDVSQQPIRHYMTSSAPATPPHANQVQHSTYGFSVSQESTSKLEVSNSAIREGFNILYHEIEFEKKIGAGAFGEVWKGEWAGTSVAIKKILKVDISEDDLKEFATEILLISKLRHPNVVQFLGACMEPEFCLVIEFMDRGTLFDAVQKNELSWKLKVSLISDVARGLFYLHSRVPPIIHRDVKSLNILVCFYFLFFPY